MGNSDRFSSHLLPLATAACCALMVAAQAKTASSHILRFDQAVLDRRAFRGDRNGKTFYFGFNASAVARPGLGVSRGRWTGTECQGGRGLSVCAVHVGSAAVCRHNLSAGRLWQP
jgi:hypothetical protein